MVACKGQILKDDVFFFREMVNYLKKNYPVDVNRIYASGFSNGANFVSRLTLDASDILAATTMMAGFLQDTSFQAKSLISSYLAIGDLNVLKSAGVMPSWGENALELTVLSERVMVMVDELKLGRTAKFIEEEKIITWLFDQNKSNSNNEFRFSLIKDLDHKYPNGKNYPMVIADLFWDFFKKFQK
jgi:poly(3-hydroxybutyrate) depolymerase